MKFLADNWFFVLVLIAFFFMMSRHGGCGMHAGHGGHAHKTEDNTADKTEAFEQHEIHAHH